MTKTETHVLNDNPTADRGLSGFRRFLSILLICFGWTFLSALVIGCLVAGMWTIIPTEQLAWGASKVNLIGYISHCSFTPISTLTLLGLAGVGALFMKKMPLQHSIGAGVFLCASVGTAIGLIHGIDIITFAGMGAGVGVGFVLALLFGFFQKQEGGGI